MSNLSDKIIDDQGNARTYSSGYDSRLHYVDVNGQDKKYLIDGEGGGGIPNPLTFGPAEIFSDSNGTFHIKFNCVQTGDDYLDLCFYVHTAYDGEIEARCELSYNKLEFPEEQDPYYNTKYIFRGAYNDQSGDTYFTTSDFEEDGPNEDNPSDDEYEDCPSCGEHTLHFGYCNNCGYNESDGPLEEENPELDEPPVEN